jgi:hypothetical protein
VVKHREENMSSKKPKPSKKTVTIHVDADALHKLRDAVEALSEYAGAYSQAVDDQAVRR